MKNQNNKASFATTCRQCGQELPPGTQTCPGCGKATPAALEDQDPWAQWSKVGKSLKTRWVISVVVFWISAAVLSVMFFVRGTFDFILASITLGMLFVGMWLKTKYQLHQKKEPTRNSPHVQPD
ncbi:MAG: hypothetical protein KJN79_03515 [Gammaproteobacteria bacterium]|nr:hypothetical protein [Gammaproteobacteria bacterium]